ncbi:MAG: four helix bundle protein [Nitrospirota bacterium]
MKKSLIKEKSYEFALKIIEIYKLLVSQNEYVLSKQLLKSGTSIGANVEEALAGQSRADFLSKMSIASKEARETKYWLNLLGDSSFLNKKLLAPLVADADSLIKILTSIVKTTAANNSKPKTKNSKLSN